MISRRRAAALSAVALTATLLVGCSADEPGEDPTATDTVAATSEPTATDTPEVEAPEEPAASAPDSVIDIVVPPGTADDGFVGAADDVEVTRCEAADGWQVEGTVTNPEGSAQSYRIYVSLLDGTETSGLVQVDVTGVPSGETQEWATSVALSAADLSCVVRVERFAG